jgi:hypothetical protein
MTDDSSTLHALIAEVATLIQNDVDPDPHLYALFLQRPDYAFGLIDHIHALEEEKIEEDSPVYSACILGLDVCVAQLQIASETNNKAAAKALTQLMDYLASVIGTHKHSLGFWLPVLNAFYEVHVELSEPLKDAYFELAHHDEEDTEFDEEPLSHAQAIRALIQDLDGLSDFDIAENFFAQSYAMPADFFMDLIEDLYSIEEGQEIALLSLLHPKHEVRDVVIETLERLMPQITLSSQSLSRLQTMKHWFGQNTQATFDRWIIMQRKKGVVFEAEPVQGVVEIRASEVDGMGSQGILMHVRKNKKNRVCGLLLKYGQGIKDAWVTPIIPASEVADYYRQAVDDAVTLREVDLDYLQRMVEHYLAVTMEKHKVPGVHFLEIQELLGVRFKPKKLDLAEIFEELSVAITPFTQESITEAMTRSKAWLKAKKFTESWYIENPLVDKIVNHNSSFIDGVKVCRLRSAMDEVFTEEMEHHREQWQFHFLWMALWARAKPKKNEKLWQDCFLIAYSIHQGKALQDIPVMKEICHQTVINSVETMQERKTHLSKE